MYHTPQINGRSVPPEVAVNYRIRDIEDVATLFEYFESEDTYLFFIELKPSSVDLFDYLAKERLRACDALEVFKKIVRVFFKLRACWSIS